MDPRGVDLEGGPHQARGVQARSISRTIGIPARRLAKQGRTSPGHVEKALGTHPARRRPHGDPRACHGDSRHKGVPAHRRPTRVEQRITMVGTDDNAWKLVRATPVGFPMICLHAGNARRAVPDPRRRPHPQLRHPEAQVHGTTVRLMAPPPLCRYPHGRRAGIC